MKSITDLPSEDLYPLIFRNLSIEDLFNCRLVNKQFKYFSDHTDGISKLIIGQPYSPDEDYYWCYNNKLIEDKDTISLQCFRSIKLLSIFNLDKNLKYLKIYDEELELEELTNLINLESLEFGFDNDKQQIINLNNLKIFASSDLSVKLNTPKLEKIQFNNSNLIELNSNRGSIKHLITTKYDNKLEIFKNLEIIELRDADQSINENLLIIFKNLKQLKVNLGLFDNYLNLGINNSLIEILNNKTKLRREIDIYLGGVQIVNMDKFNELIANRFSIWQFRLNNYDLLDLNLLFINYLNYKELERCVNNIENDLPSTFFDKFQYIHQVSVYSDVKNVNGLNWFLNNLKYLKRLRLFSSLSLDEVFYNNLPNTIKYLFIYNNEDINYDFILKLSKLIHFYTDVDKDLFDLAFTSFLNLKYLKNFGFYFKGRFIKIIKKNGKDFYLNDYDKKEKLDYNQLLEECNVIRSK